MYLCLFYSTPFYFFNFLVVDLLVLVSCKQNSISLSLFFFKLMVVVVFFVLLYCEIVVDV